MSARVGVSADRAWAPRGGARVWRLFVVLFVWVFLGEIASVSTVRAEPLAPLRVCLEANSPPFSSRVGISALGGPKHGLDHDVAVRVAEALGRSLEVFWFEAAQEEEDLLARQVAVLFAAGRCDLVGGYPLTRDGLRAGARSLRASRPYLALPLTLVVAESTALLRRLDEAAGLRLAVERDSLASAIAAVYSGGRLQPGLVRFAFEPSRAGDTLAGPHRKAHERGQDGDGIFAALERQEADVAFIEAHRFALYRARQPDTRLRSTGYRHGLAVNTGFVGVVPTLLQEVDAALGLFLSTDRVASIVETYGLDYASPVAPAILPPLTPRLLAQSDHFHSSRSQSAPAPFETAESTHARER